MINKETDLSIIICTKNRAKQVSLVLQCLGYQKDIENINWEIIIVDNNSTDNTKEVAYAFCEGSNLNVKYVLETNEGSANARNAGINSAKGVYLLFLDDDVLLPNNFVSNALMGIQDFPEFHIFGFRILPDWHDVKNQPFWLSLKSPFKITQNLLPMHDLGFEPLRYPNRFMKSPISSAFLCQSSVFENIGLFREDLGIGEGKAGLHEDTEFFYYAILNGIKLLYWPHATLYHSVDPNRLSVSYLHNWYFKSGKSMYKAKYGERLFNFRKKHMVGSEGYIANKLPGFISKLLLDVKILKAPLLLWMKLLLFVLLMPVSLLLMFINKTFYMSTKLAYVLGEINQAMNKPNKYKKVVEEVEELEEDLVVST